MDNKQKIIVTLTSFPEAIPYAVQSIQSVLAGSILPDKIVLYLDTQKFPGSVLPPELEALKVKSKIFEIRFDPTEIRSYKKLIPALKDFPNDVIVTIDDDIKYHPNLLRDLINLHKRLPNAIIAHRVRKVKLNAPYSAWKKYRKKDFILKKIHLSHLALLTGVGGVLYPPHSLDENMLNPKLFMSLAPTCDDIWFWLAAVSRGTYVVPLPNGRHKVKEIGKPKEISLKTINIKSGNDRNRETLERVLDYYPSIRLKLEQEESNNKSFLSKIFC